MNADEIVKGSMEHKEAKLVPGKSVFICVYLWFRLDANEYQ